MPQLTDQEITDLRRPKEDVNPFPALDPTSKFNTNALGLDTVISTGVSEAAIDGEILPVLDKAPGVLPPQLRGVDLQTIHCRSDLIRALNKNLPLNEYGFPELIYRADLLDYNMFHEHAEYQTMRDALITAEVQVHYAEAYPTQSNGRPIWEQLEQEPEDSAFLLKKYLEIPGARQLSDLVSSRLSGETLREWYYFYYWDFRAKAFDTFSAAHHARIREQRILSTTDKHFLAAEGLWTKLETALKSINLETIQEDPIAIVELMEKVTKMQRVALGLPGNGNATPPQAQLQSFELTMKTLTKRAEGDAPQSQLTEDTRSLLNDPDAIERAQELIISFNRQGK